MTPTDKALIEHLIGLLPEKDRPSLYDGEFSRWDSMNEDIPFDPLSSLDDAFECLNAVLASSPGSTFILEGASNNGKLIFRSWVLDQTCLGDHSPARALSLALATATGFKS